MKLIVNGAFIIIIICIAFCSCSQRISTKKVAPFGVNLAGAEFGTIGKDNYWYPTASELDYYKSKGLTLFRFPFKWERIQPKLNGPLDATELSKMKTFLDSASSKGLWVILDMHNYGRRVMNGATYIIGSPELPVSSIVDGWVKIGRIQVTNATF